MRKPWVAIFVAATVAGLTMIPVHWQLSAQDAQEVEETDVIPEEMDEEFTEILEVLEEDPELLEELMSDPEFAEVFEDFDEDVGIEEEDVPFELLKEGDDFSEEALESEE